MIISLFLLFYSDATINIMKLIVLLEYFGTKLYLKN